MRRDGVDVETSRGVCGVEPSGPRQGKLSDWIRPVKKSWRYPYVQTPYMLCGTKQSPSLMTVHVA
jgi:hypothetical protein